MGLTMKMRFSTADVVKALEGGAQTEAARRMQRDWIKSLFCKENAT